MLQSDAHFDLTKVFLEFTGPTFAKLREAIERYHSVASALADLKAAKILIDRAWEQKNIYDAGRAKPTELDKHIVQAIVSQAVIRYARATTTSPIDRRKSGPEGKLKGDDRAAHERVINVRNHVVAHFGRGDDLGPDYWFNERVVLSMPSGIPVVLLAYEQVTFPTGIMRDLNRILPQVIVRASRLRLNVAVDIIKEIDNATANSPDFIRKLDKSRFDLGEIYKNPTDIAAVHNHLRERAKIGRITTGTVTAEEEQYGR